jgi:hypothetical protein
LGSIQKLFPPRLNSVLVKELDASLAPQTTAKGKASRLPPDYQTKRQKQGDQN